MLSPPTLEEVLNCVSEPPADRVRGTDRPRICALILGPSEVHLSLRSCKAIVR